MLRHNYTSHKFANHRLHLQIDSQTSPKSASFYSVTRPSGDNSQFRKHTEIQISCLFLTRAVWPENSLSRLLWECEREPFFNAIYRVGAHTKVNSTTIVACDRKQANLSPLAFRLSFSREQLGALARTNFFSHMKGVAQT